MPLYVYRCSNRHETEALRARDVLSIPCPQCRAQSHRQPFYVVAGQMGGSRDWTSPVRDGGRIRTPVNERPIHMRQYR